MADDRAEIKIRSGELPRAFDETAAALYAADVPFFVRAGRLCRPRRLQDARHEGGISRPKGMLELVEVGISAMRLAIEEATAFLRYDQRAGDYVRANPPAALVEALIAVSDRAQWRRAVAVCDHPLVNLENGKPIQGDYCEEPDAQQHFDFYDPRTEIVFDYGGDGWPRVPPEPQQKDAEAAVARLTTLFRHMPFAGEADQAVAISAVVTAVVAPLLSSMPGHAIDAAAPGSGKSLLADAIGVIATGAPPATIEWPRDHDEGAKRLDALLMSGTLVINLDNVEGTLGGAALCQTLTQARRDVRPLGRSEIIRVPTCSLILATGNNLSVKGDAVRRFLVSRLDPKVELPELRTFDQDLRAVVRQERQGLVLAALTIVSAYALAGRPSVGTTPLGSFESWSRSVRDALVWAGLADPVHAQEQLRAADPDRESAIAVLSAWRAAFGDRAVTVAEAASSVSAHPELREAFEMVAGKAGHIDPRRFGYWLRAHRDWRIAGMILTAEQTRTKSHCWKVVLA